MPTEIMNSVQLLTLTMVRGIKQSAKIQVQWNPSVTDTFGDQHFVRYSEVSPTQELPVLFPVGIVLRNLAVEGFHPTLVILSHLHKYGYCPCTLSKVDLVQQH